MQKETTKNWNVPSEYDKYNLEPTKQVQKILQNKEEEPLPKEIAELLRQITRKRFSVQWKLT